LVKGFVELHCGRVAAHSEGLGQGSVLSVSLAALPPEDSAPALFPPAMLVQATVGQVLIADAIADAAETLSMLVHLGWHETQTT